MRRATHKTVLAGLLVLAGAEWFGTPAARAQYPIFFGGEVLTPFGQRNSDGSYKNRAAAPRRQAVARPRLRYRAAPRVYAAPPVRYYYVPNGYRR